MTKLAAVSVNKVGLANAGYQILNILCAAQHSFFPDIRSVVASRFTRPALLSPRPQSLEAAIQAESSTVAPLESPTKCSFGFGPIEQGASESDLYRQQNNPQLRFRQM